MQRIIYLPNSYSQQRQFQKPANIYPVLMAMQAQWYKNNGHQVFWKEIPEENKFKWGAFVDKVIYAPEDITFSMLPHPDRVWTKAYEYTSGNYKYLPGTHIMSASGCWWGKCSFCVENGQPYEVRPVEDVISEIEECKALGFKSLFDDSATFPDNQWCYEFCKRVIKLKVNLGCNLRINSNVDFELMKNAGFEMVLIGIESANESTLEKINKGIKIKDIIPIFQNASKVGLAPHATAIIGFPFETYEDTMQTINLVKYLLIKGYAKTAQISFYVPPKDQPQGNELYRKYVTKFYEVGFNPEFWYNKITSIKSIADLHYLIRGIQKGFSALLKRRLT
jgi:radical SAM superfamily enzyme YgiQ (UPF0313 family)